MGLWIAILSMLGAFWGGPGLAVLLLIGLPLLGLMTLWLRDVFGASWRQARRYLLLRYRPQLRDELLQEQAELAQALDRLNREFPAP